MCNKVFEIIKSVTYLHALNARSRNLTIFVFIFDVAGGCVDSIMKHCVYCLFIQNKFNFIINIFVIK
jgi:hypothetical protein